MLYNKSELSNFCKTALMAQGVSEKNAQVTTALLIEADEMGIHSHGVKNLHKYIEKSGWGNSTLPAKSRSSVTCLVVQFWTRITA